METFHLYHLAACWGGRSPAGTAHAPPLTTGPVKPIISQLEPSSPSVTTPTPQVPLQDTVIRVAAAQMIFASRTSQAFITPEQVTELEIWTGVVGSFVLPEDVPGPLENRLTEPMVGCAGCAK